MPLQKTGSRYLLVTSLLLMLGVPVIAADPENGEALYLAHGCYSCHGYNGTGMTPLTDRASAITRDEDLFLTYLRLRADQNPMLPALTMPNFSVEVLSDDEARDIFAYVNLLTDDAPEFEDIPAFEKIMKSGEEVDER